MKSDWLKSRDRALQLISVGFAKDEMSSCGPIYSVLAVRTGSKEPTKVFDEIEVTGDSVVRFCVQLRRGQDKFLRRGYSRRDLDRGWVAVYVELSDQADAS